MNKDEKQFHAEYYQGKRASQYAYHIKCYSVAIIGAVLTVLALIFDLI